MARVQPDPSRFEIVRDRGLKVALLAVREEVEGVVEPAEAKGSSSKPQQSLQLGEDRFGGVALGDQTLADLGVLVDPSEVLGVLLTVDCGAIVPDHEGDTH